MRTAAQIYLEQFFDQPHDDRSREYRDGVLEVSDLRLENGKKLKCPYRMGTAEADAWFAGKDEAFLLWKLNIDENSE